jgi:O-antigen ligase
VTSQTANEDQIPRRRLQGRGVLALIVLCFGILTLWVPEYWPITAFHLGAFSLFAVTFYRDAKVLRRNGLTVPVFALGLIALWGGLQLLAGTTVGALDTAMGALSWAALFALFLAGLSVLEDLQTRIAFRGALLWFTFILSAVSTLQMFTSGGKVFWIFPTGYVDNVMGPILNTNHYAAWIELILPIALFEAFTERHNALLYTGMAAAMYASVISSGSRTGAILCTVELVLVPVLVSARGRVPLRAVGSALAKMVASMAAFTAVVGWEVLWKRLTMPDPFFLRREFVISSLNMIRDRPLLGFGLGTWPTVYPAYAIFDTGLVANRAHNQWLEWAAEGGIPFAMLLLAVAVWAARPAFRTIWGLGVVSIFLHSLVDYPLQRPQLAAWVIILIAMLAAENREIAVT